MPLVSRLFIKTGVVWLLLSILLIAFIHLPGTGISRMWMPVFYHMLMVGWVTQIIFGVAIWMFPGDRSGRVKGAGPNKTKGNVVVHYVVYALLNAGLLMRVILEPAAGGFAPSFLSGMIGGTVSAWISYMLAVSGGLQLIAFIGFAHQIWPRIRGKRHA